MDTFFNINPLGMEGLGATLTSLIRNCSNSKELKLWFLCSSLHQRDKDNILQLLQNEGFQGISEFIDFDAMATFGHLRSLHGDWTTYGRLLIPNIIKSGSALYLDSDLIIECDILDLHKIKNDSAISAVLGCPVQYALENQFFIKTLNWHPDTHYFNAGVLVFNIPLWEEQNIALRVKEISDNYSNEFLSADQTLLNAICEGNFGHLPKEFNMPWYPSNPQPKNNKNVILHFVGSPKPWDIFGKTIHAGYDTWNTYNTSFWEKEYDRLTFSKLVRTWKIRKSIFKNFKNKLTKKNDHLVN